MEGVAFDQRIKVGRARAARWQNQIADVRFGS
jgi:hypothetical protein